MHHRLNQYDLFFQKDVVWNVEFSVPIPLWSLANLCYFFCSKRQQHKRNDKSGLRVRWNAEKYIKVFFFLLFCEKNDLHVCTSHLNYLLDTTVSILWDSIHNPAIPLSELRVDCLICRQQPVQIYKLERDFTQLI